MTTHENYHRGDYVWRLLLAFWCVACSDDKPTPPASSGSSNAGGDSGGAVGGSTIGGGGAVGGGGAKGALLEAPHCEQDQLRIQGEAIDQPVNHSESLGSTTLTGRQFYTVESDKSRLLLLWGTALEPNTITALTTGGYFRSFWEAAQPEELYCVDQGAITLLEARPEDKYIKFNITKARSGEVGSTPFAGVAECDGPEVSVALQGCVFRYAN